MGLLEAKVRRHFRDEKVGRVVVFARGGRDRGYIVNSGPEEAKIISFLKMFYFAEHSILLLGSSLAFAWSIFFTNLQSLGRPESHLVRTVGIYLGIYTLLVGIPDWLLWRSYKTSFSSFVSAEHEVALSRGAVGRQAWIAYAVAALALVILALSCFYLVRAK
jgi:hypothetical protein